MTSFLGGLFLIGTCVVVIGAEVWHPLLQLHGEHGIHQIGLQGMQGWHGIQLFGGVLNWKKLN